MGIFNSIHKTKAKFTSYYIGLLQAKGYRILHKHTTEVLEKYKVTPLEWGLLGTLFSSEEPIPVTMLGQELGVETPFVTALIDRLSKVDLVEKKADTADRRTKLLSLTPKGRKLVPEIEKHVRDQIRFLIKGPNTRDFIGYYKVLSAIIENSKK